jgi:hypothetical protein
MPRRRSPHYSGEINYHSINIPNAEPKQIRDTLSNLPFIAYHVETLEDGRKICITKPGGKQFWGVLQPNDFMVWVYDEVHKDRWRVSHNEIYEDLEAKLVANPGLSSTFIDKLLDVCNGAEPNEMTKSFSLAIFSELPGFSAELILKTYKWIWVQEDCNYPNGEGRWMSMNPILALRKQMISGA